MFGSFYFSHHFLTLLNMFACVMVVGWLTVYVCLVRRTYTAWCEIMTSENDNESNGKEPIFYKFLTTWMVFPSFFLIWCKHQRLDILCRCRHGPIERKHFQHTFVESREHINLGFVHSMPRSLHYDHEHIRAYNGKSIQNANSTRFNEELSISSSLMVIYHFIDAYCIYDAYAVNWMGVISEPHF